jgi:hypothetical protein
LKNWLVSKSLHNTTTREGMFLNVCETMTELNPPWTKLTGIPTDGAPSIIGKKTSLMDKIRRDVMNKIPNFTCNFTE